MSFSAEVKFEALGVPMKKTCCRRAFILGALFLGAALQNDRIVMYADGAAVETYTKLISEQFGRTSEVTRGERRGMRLMSFQSHTAALALRQAAETGFERLLKCPECSSAFVRGLFIGGGTVNSPDKQYHLELKSRMWTELGIVSARLETCGFSFKISHRLGVETLYMKDSSGIEDFLFYIGANRNAFAFMNAKIGHELKNEVNRRSNCDTGNIARSTAASARQLAAIRFLMERGGVSELGPELEYTASMRLKYPEMSLLQLGQIMVPAVSKPGLYHRLEKICAHAENIKETEENLH